MNIYQDGYLPNRMLTDDDKPPHCQDLFETVNLALMHLFQIPIDLYPELRNIWYEPTCCWYVRRHAQIAIDVAPVSETIASAFYANALIEVLLYGCDNY
jgi:hypothetical protein